jgi:pseudouridine kinase
MMPGRPVLVIGASGIDIKARPAHTLQLTPSNVGVVRHNVGGVARNIAENLSRLEIPTLLLSAVGNDSSGEFVLSQAASAGVDTSRMLRLPDVSTGSYVAILNEIGEVAVAISHYDIVDAISPGYLQRNRKLFSDAEMVVIDASLTPRALESVFHWAGHYNVPVCADPTSQTLAAKLIEYLPRLYMVAPDASEAAVLCGDSKPPATSEDGIATAQCLVSRGAEIAIVTLAEQGLVYASGSSAGHIPAMRTQVVDKTGIGDALTAAVICGLLNGMPLDEAMRLGVSAATLTLRTQDTVYAELSLDRLYDELVV